jgi:prepilin-type N-terminal cleavage/methylation domain-containing protein
MKLPTHAPFRTPGSRGAFTLVELMVVIAIIAVVISLGASATMQVITRQKTANTELTIQKVNDALKAHWQALIQKAQTEQIPDNILYGDGTMQGLLVMAGGDPANPDTDSMKRARLIWVKLRLKQQFPMNFMEALNPTPNTVKSPGGKPYVLLPPAPVFVRQTPPLKASNPPQSFESSVCLLLALSQASRGVVPFDQDRFSSLEIADSQLFDPTLPGLKLIVDGWGRPLAFYRWPVGGELAASNPNKATSFGDQLDPNGLLVSPRWNTPAAYSGRGGVWAFEKLCHSLHDAATGKPASPYTVPVVASAGPSAGTKPANQPYLSVYDLMGLSAPQERPPAVPLPAALLPDPMDMVSGKPESLDNIYSFRMRFGARGD